MTAAAAIVCLIALFILSCCVSFGAGYLMAIISPPALPLDSELEEA